MKEGAVSFHLLLRGANARGEDPNEFLVLNQERPETLCRNEFGHSHGKLQQAIFQVEFPSHSVTLAPDVLWLVFTNTEPMNVERWALNVFFFISIRQRQCRDCAVEKIIHVAGRWSWVTMDRNRACPVNVLVTPAGD